jgi:hypothetical protein
MDLKKIEGVEARSPAKGNQALQHRTRMHQSSIFPRGA